MNITDHLQVKCGNPETAGTPEIENIPAATFSRFVFPFAYHLEKSNEQPQSLFYRKNDGSSHPHRKKYLTTETALVLFERAKWFEIPPQAWQNTPWETNRKPAILK